MKHGVLLIGESDILREKCGIVPKEQILTDVFQDNLALLKKTLVNYKRKTGKGRGIAAPQIGLSIRVFLILLNGNIITIINPSVIRVSSNRVKYPEVCMSAEPIIAPVVRPSWVEFEYFDGAGRRKKWAIKDKTKRGKILNRVCLHELDHLDGIVNIDRVSSQELMILTDPKFYDKATFEKV